MLSSRGQRIVVAVDMDYFYAQCEELRYPAYAGKPIVVGMYSGRTDISGAVATSNYSARKYGVKSGMPLARAKSLLDGVDSLFVKADFAYYESISSMIMDVLRAYSKVFAQASIDEAFVDISDRVNGDYGAAKELAKKIKEDIFKKTRIRCSVGVGPNRLIAKMACDASKPDGLKVVKPDEVEEFLAEKPVDALYGVGGKTADRLKALGITKIGELAKMPLHRLQEEFGPKLGLYFSLSSKGIDEEPLEEREREQIGRMMTLKEDTRNIEDLADSFSKMAEDITKELTAQGVSYRTVTIVLVDTELKHHTRSRTLKVGEADAFVAVPVAKSLAEGFLSENPDSVIRRVGLTVSSLLKQEGQRPLTAYFDNG